MRRPLKRRVSKTSKNLEGFRSKEELHFAHYLSLQSIPYSYEDTKISYYLKKNYIPDFYLPSLGFYVEYKGYFAPEDRAKHLCIIKQHPEIDIRIIFSNSSKPIRKGSQTTYGDWCKKHGILYSDKVIPSSWLAGSI